LTFDLGIRTRARFLYNAPNRQVAKFHHPAFNRSEVIVRTKKNTQTDKQTPPKTPRFATLRRWINIVQAMGYMLYVRRQTRAITNQLNARP